MIKTPVPSSGIGGASVGIYAEWDKFCKMAEDNVGTAGASLPPPASWRDDISSFLDAGKIFLEFLILSGLIIINFYLWLDIIMLQL